MTPTQMNKMLAIVTCAMCLSIAGCKETDSTETPRIVNFINFVRDIEPRIESITPEVLFETTRQEALAIHQYGFKGTWLLQYDALIDPRYQDMMREEIAHGCEVGGWWEITQPHVEAAGLTWRGRYPWDWHADKGFAVGYTQEERERLVDVYMENTVDVPVVSLNFPGDRQLRTFPSAVQVTYTVGYTRNREVTRDKFVSVVTYEEILDLQKQGKTKIPIRLKSIPDGVSNVRIQPQEVDYLVETVSEEE